MPWPWGKAGGVSDTRMLGPDRGLRWVCVSWRAVAEPSPGWMTRAGGPQVRGQGPGLLSLMTVHLAQLLWRLGGRAGPGHPPHPSWPSRPRSALGQQ